MFGHYQIIKNFIRYIIFISFSSHIALTISCVQTKTLCFLLNEHLHYCSMSQTYSKNILACITFKKYLGLNYIEVRLSSPMFRTFGPIKVGLKDVGLNNWAWTSFTWRIKYAGNINKMDVYGSNLCPLKSLLPLLYIQIFQSSPFLCPESRKNTMWR